MESKTRSSRIVLVIANRIFALNIRAALACAVMCMLVTGCAKHKSSRAPAKPPKPARIGSTEKGEASWYGEPYHGRRAASGEVYNMEQLTAAHRSLPFQTWVEVTNLKNGKQVNVRINDRGPFVNGRIIDLSRAAAREIDMVRMGIAPVRLRVIKPPRVSSADPLDETRIVSETAPPPPTSSGEFAVQAGAFRDRSRAETLAASLLLFDVVEVIPPMSSAQPLWKILVGKNLTFENANVLVTDVKLLIDQAFIVRDPR